MREFRGKREDNGEWAVGYYLKICDKHKIYVPFTEEEKKFFKHSKYEKLGGRYKIVIPETVGQFTGLTDKNGKKIFEGDIVEIEEHGYIPTKYKGFVVLKNGCFGVEYNYRVIFYEKLLFHRFGHIEHWQEMGASGTITYSYEVIGNVHDNPELIEKERI